MPANTTQNKRFLGLNNVSDPLRLKFGWLQKADNMDITDTGALVRREGYAKVLAGAISGVYSTEDYARMYLVDSGVLYQIDRALGKVDLRTGMTPRPMHWAQINDQVFFNNGVDSGVVLADGEVLDLAWPMPNLPSLAAITGTLPAGTYQVAFTHVTHDGRETGAGDASTLYLDGTQALQINEIPFVAGYETLVYIAPADSTVFQLAYVATGVSMTWNSSPGQLGADLTTQALDPLPGGCEYLAFWKGQLYASQYFPDSASSAIWVSEPLGFHLFDLNANFILVPGKVTLLVAHEEGLVIGTESKIHVYNGELMKEVANYGAVPGYGWAKDGADGPVLFWTTRGLCSALPLSNLTLRQISVDCGVSAGAAIIEKDGSKKYVVALQKGGENFNQRGIL